MSDNKLLQVAGLVAVGLGLGVIFLIAVCAIFLLAWQLKAPTESVVAVATGAFGS